MYLEAKESFLFLSNYRYALVWRYFCIKYLFLMLLQSRKKRQSCKLNFALSEKNFESVDISSTTNHNQFVVENHFNVFSSLQSSSNRRLGTRMWFIIIVSYLNYCGSIVYYKVVSDQM